MRKISIEKLELLEEVEMLTMGLPEDAYATINSTNILFDHLNQLYGNTAKISVEHLRSIIEMLEMV